MEDWRPYAPGRTIPLFVAVKDEKGPAHIFYQTPKFDATINGLGR
jgi:hypothetical protein